MRGVSLTSTTLLLTLLATSLFAAVPATAEADGAYAWSTRSALGNTALRVSLELSADAECTFAWTMGGSQQAKGGPMLFYFIERVEDDARETFGSTIFSAYDSHQVHAGDVDSRPPLTIDGVVSLFPTGTFGASGSVAGPFPAGTYDFTLGGWDLRPTTEDPTRLGYNALGVDIDCAAPLTVQAFFGSHELLMFSPANMDGGIGVFESLVAHVSIDDEAAFEFTSTQVDSHVHWREYQDGGHAYGTLERTTPDGVVVYDLTTPAQVFLRDTTGPGLHRYVLDRVALDFFSTMNGIVYGLDALDAPDGLVP